MYFIEFDRWLKGGNMTTPRSGHGCCMDKDQNHIFAFGGYKRHYYLASIEEYDIVSGISSILHFVSQIIRTKKHIQITLITETWKELIVTLNRAVYYPR